MLVASSLGRVYSRSQNAAAPPINVFPWGAEAVVLSFLSWVPVPRFPPHCSFLMAPFQVQHRDSASQFTLCFAFFPLFPSSLISFCESRLKTLSSTYALCLLHVFQPNYSTGLRQNSSLPTPLLLTQATEFISCRIRVGSVLKRILRLNTHTYTQTRERCKHVHTHPPL